MRAAARHRRARAWRLREKPQSRSRRRRRQVTRPAAAKAQKVLAMVRPLLRWRYLRWLLVVLVPLLLINLSVSFFGRCWVFPLSPSFLRPKLRALALYAAHRPRCLGVPHPPLAPLAGVIERRHHLPKGLLAAVIEVESSGRVHRISPAGAMGPAQLAPSTARLLGVVDPFDPEESLDGAARYLAQQWRAFHDLRLTAAAYNAGPGAIVRRQIPHNGETEIYVERVMRALARLAPPRPIRAPASASGHATPPHDATAVRESTPPHDATPVRESTPPHDATPAPGSTPRHEATRARASAPAHGTTPARGSSRSPSPAGLPPARKPPPSRPRPDPRPGRSPVRDKGHRDLTEAS